MSLPQLLIKRPLAVSMVYLGLALLGVIAWQRMPVELMPQLGADELTIRYYRPGSEPEVVERELLMPLEARASTLAGVVETRGEVSGSRGTLLVRFAPGSDLKVRELELRGLVAEMARAQPAGSSVEVATSMTSAVSGFAMAIQVTGIGDRHALHELVRELMEPRIKALPGVSRAIAVGGTERQVTIRLDYDRAAALGVPPAQVRGAVARAVQRLRFLGRAESEAGHTSVVIDGRMKGLASLAETRLFPGSPILLRHVADVEEGPGDERMLFRINGKPAVGMMIFQESDANLVHLGRVLRSEIEQIRSELQPLGIDLLIGFDGAQLVERQLARLGALALSGFLIALVVLYLFLRQWRAVVVVAVPVPISLLIALALLELCGQSLNLLSLFGLAVAVGMLVDNSVVVFDAVQKRLERGYDPDRAAVDGVRRTLRAILAASVCTGIVFLPVVLTDFDSAMIRSLLQIVALSIVLPLGASLLVAVGLVPLLARWLVAPAAERRLEQRRRERAELGGRGWPDRPRALLTGLLTVALRRPQASLFAVAAAILFTVAIAGSWLTLSTLSQEAAQADEVRMDLRLSRGGSLEATTVAFQSFEKALGELAGVDRVESFIQEGRGSLTIQLAPRDERPPGLTAASLWQLARELARRMPEVQVLRPDEENGGNSNDLGSLLVQGAQEIVISGPDNHQLALLAAQVRQRLEALPQVAAAWLPTQEGSQELWVIPDKGPLTAMALTADQVLPLLRGAGREGVEMQTGFLRDNGRELSVLILRSDERQAGLAGLSRLPLATAAGSLPLEALADLRQVPPQPSILHRNGRRELNVYYRLDSQAPRSGPGREELLEQITGAIRQVHLPPGYSLDTAQGGEDANWFRRLLVPVVLLLFLVLAITFESITLPLLVLVALPLTLLGSIWALVLMGLPLDVMAMVGALALLGLTVNPAILLVDRMQHRVLTVGWPPGAAAVAAVHERARAILATTATSVVGLWPLALSTGQEMEIWPPFATVLMGGLVSSTLLTMLVIPVGFVLLRRLDGLFGRLSPWFVLAWIGTTAVSMLALSGSGLITSLVWQVVTTLLIAGALLSLAVLVVWRELIPEPGAAAGRSPTLEVRSLRKVYGAPGPIRRAWELPRTFSRRLSAAEGRAYQDQRIRDRRPPLLALALGSGYLGWNLETLGWSLLAWFGAAYCAASLLLDWARRPEDGGPAAEPSSGEQGGTGQGGAGQGGTGSWRQRFAALLAGLLPWLALGLVVYRFHVAPRLAGGETRIGLVGLVLLGAVLALVQLGRRTARGLVATDLHEQAGEGVLHQLRLQGRLLARRLLGLDLPNFEVQALRAASFRVEEGMVGLLGPNGAGKTTLLRLLAGVLDPTRGRIVLGGVPLDQLRRYLGRWIGYLPQETVLPKDLTAREYLDYFALMFQIGPAAARLERIEYLLGEVGLADRADELIGGFSGGMRQRLAVARSLLRLPPLIIVDEPTVGLDPRERIHFRNLLVRLAHGRVVLFSTHVVEDVAATCDRVLVLASGRLLFDGPPARLASAASGKIWELVVDAGGQPELSAEARVADRAPREDGRTVWRILAAEKPHTEAQAAEPSLEEGYLQLIGRRAR